MVISGDHNEPIKRREFNRLFHIAGQTTNDAMRCNAIIFIVEIYLRLYIDNLAALIGKISLEIGKISEPDM
jgi:hypothetical protein